MNPAPLTSLLRPPGTPPSLGPERRSGTPSVEETEHAAAAALGDAPHPRAPEITALVLLWHDHLEAAHELVQERPGADAAWVHGILHRREPDAGNCADWFRRVGRHAAFPALAAAVAALPRQAGLAPLRDRLTAGGAWDPFAFIGAAADAEGAAAEFLRAVQAAEFTVLLGHIGAAR